MKWRILIIIIHGDSKVMPMPNQCIFNVHKIIYNADLQVLSRTIRKLNGNRIFFFIKTFHYLFYIIYAIWQESKGGFIVMKCHKLLFRLSLFLPIDILCFPIDLKVKWLFPHYVFWKFFTSNRIFFFPNMQNCTY